MNETYAAAVLAYWWEEFVESLTDAERLVLPYMHELWLRPEQRIDYGPWLTYGTIGGRGSGKTRGAAVYVNRVAESGSEYTEIGLMAPTEKRAEQVQIAALIETAPPWCKPEKKNGEIVWPTGARGIIFSAEAAGKPRGSNLSLSWACELVDWPATSRLEAWQNLVLATRVGLKQIVYDTTSKGKNNVILDRLADHARDPQTHRLVRSTSFDNPLLDIAYLREVRAMYAPGSQRYAEEILGEVFQESALALWQQAWIDDNRKAEAPARPAVTILALDPAQSARESADETGLVVACRDAEGHIYVLEDHSGHLTAEQSATIIVKRCAQDAAGVVIESNKIGDSLRDLIKVIAEQKNMVLQELVSGKPFPPRVPGRIYIRKTHARETKQARAEAPAQLYSQGRVHHVGTFDVLETEMTTWEPDSSPSSPNRLDALAYVVAELADVAVYNPRRPALDAVQASKAHETLRAELMRLGRGLRVGL